MNNQPKSYLEAFKTLKAEASQSFVLNGDCIIVEALPQEEYKSASGIVIAKSIRQVDTIEDNRPTLVRVLLVGEGYYNEETNESVPLDVEAGDILLIGKLGVKWLSSFAGMFTQEGSAGIGLTRESEIQLKFKGQEGYDKVTEVLKGAIK